MNPWQLARAAGASDPQDLNDGIQAMFDSSASTAPDDYSSFGDRSPAGAMPSLPSAASRVKPQVKDSGMKNSGTDKATETLAKIQRAIMFPDRQTMHDVADAAYSMPQIQDERSGLEANGRALAAMAAGQRDIGPDRSSALSYLANYFTKGQAKYIEPQKSPKQTILDYALKNQDDARDLAKQVNAFIGTMRGGYSQNADTRGVTNVFQIRSGEFPRPTAGGPAADWSKWTKDPAVKSVQKVAASEEPLVQLEQMINSGNPTAEREIPITLTRAIVGTARIAQQEIALGKGDPGLSPTIEQGIQKLFHGGDGSSMLTPQNRKEYQDFLKTLRATHSDILSSNRYAAQVSADQYGINQDAAGKYLDGLSSRYKANAAAATGAPTNLQDAARAELERRKAAKGADGK